MSGVELLEVLRDLQFPKIGQCDESSFDWLFDFDEAVPFLQWFCHHISCSNRVKTEHLARLEITYTILSILMINSCVV